ncbi:MAG: hypothetical protein QF811_05180 [Candidatus Woesearchaeota archaeon]|nr:hypothetical protein [Candidatus Woesearchaeota archaeon]
MMEERAWQAGLVIVALVSVLFGPSITGFTVAPPFCQLDEDCLEIGVGDACVNNMCTSFRSIPVISDQVVCRFFNGVGGEKCYTQNDHGSYGCINEGQKLCEVKVRGREGEALTWKSSCGGTAFTSVGEGGEAVFNCGSQPVECRSDQDCAEGVCEGGNCMIVVPVDPLVPDNVVCVFKNGVGKEKCYTQTSFGDYHCVNDGSKKCKARLKGLLGEKVTWKSSCGGYDYTVIGEGGEAVFDCPVQRKIPAIIAVPDKSPASTIVFAQDVSEVLLSKKLLRGVGIVKLYGEISSLQDQVTILLLESRSGYIVVGDRSPAEHVVLAADIESALRRKGQFKVVLASEVEHLLYPEPECRQNSDCLVNCITVVGARCPQGACEQGKCVIIEPITIEPPFLQPPVIVEPIEIEIIDIEPPVLVESSEPIEVVPFFAEPPEVEPAEPIEVVPFFAEPPEVEPAEPMAVPLLKEKVKCIFKIGDKGKQTCKALRNGEFVDGCAVEGVQNIESCTLSLKGMRGTKLVWVSSCDPEKQTSVFDGVSESVRFNCKESDVEPKEEFFEPEPILIEEPEFLDLERPQPPELEERKCDGCISGGMCLPVGVRDKGEFCTTEGELRSQKPADIRCDNNFECKSNVCANGSCMDSGVFKKFLSWLGLFS